MTTTPTVLDITENDNIAARGGDKLKRRVAFVTGGTRGIGAAICRSLASQGATLAAGYAGNDDAAGSSVIASPRPTAPRSASTRATWARRRIAGAPSMR